VGADIDYPANLEIPANIPEILRDFQYMFAHGKFLECYLAASSVGQRELPRL
jgi:hypothetical protein